VEKGNGAEKKKGVVLGVEEEGKGVEPKEN